MTWKSYFDPQKVSENIHEGAVWPHVHDDVMHLALTHVELPPRGVCRPGSGCWRQLCALQLCLGTTGSLFMPAESLNFTIIPKQRGYRSVKYYSLKPEMDIQLIMILHVWLKGDMQSASDKKVWNLGDWGTEGQAVWSVWRLQPHVYPVCLLVDKHTLWRWSCGGWWEPVGLIYAAQTMIFVRMQLMVVFPSNIRCLHTNIV